MSTYTISKKTTSGFSFHSPYTTLSIAHSGYVDVGDHVAIDAGSGSAAYTVDNNGTVLGDVYLGQGGVVTNGLGDPAAQITGYVDGVFIRNAIGTVVNDGDITAIDEGNSIGVYLALGGRLTNGSTQATGALIRGNGYGAFIRNAVGTVTNFGTILSLGTTGGNTSGLYVPDGGAITNGSNGDTSALIEGSGGIEVRSGAATIANFGAIVGVGKVNGRGIGLGKGGSLVNGSVTDTTALVQGYYAGMSLGGVSGSVTNFGTIAATGATGGVVAVYLDAGSFTNGAATDRTALVSGYAGVRFGGAGTLANWGTIRAVGGAGNFAVQMSPGGILANGGVNDTQARIQGYAGATVAAATVTNFGVIEGLGGASSEGVFLSASSVINGSASDTIALVEGYAGAVVSGASTLTNFGQIQGVGGKAVTFTTIGGTLIVEAGSVFKGSVAGDAGRLDLASGTGTLTGLLTSTGAITVSGSMPTTTFGGFATLVVAAGAAFTDAGAGALAHGQAVVAIGSLTVGGGLTSAGLIDAANGGTFTAKGAFANSGTVEVSDGLLVVDGAVGGGGVVTITGGGTAEFASTFGENVTFGTSGMLELGKSQTYTGIITGFAKTAATSLDLLDIAFGAKTTAKFSGTAASGVLTVTDGTHTAKITLEGDYLASTFTVASDGHGGAKVTDPPRAAVVPAFVQAAAGVFAPAAAAAFHGGADWRPPPMLLGPRVRPA